MERRPSRYQKGRLVDLILDEGVTAEEARKILAREEEAERLVPPRERVGEESERQVMEYLATVRNVLEARRTERGGEEDRKQGWDIVVTPRMKLPFLTEFYIQVKSSQGGVESFRAEMERRVLGKHPVFWQTQGKVLSLEKYAQALKKAVDKEILKRKFILVRAGDKNGIDLDYKKGEVALYSYWRTRGQTRRK